MSSIARAIFEVQQIILGEFGDFAQPDGSIVVAFEFGTPVSLASLHSPSDPRILSPAMALEFMSNLANVVPELQQSLFVRGLTTVDGQYQTLLEGSFPADPDHSDLFASIQRSARADFSDDLGSLLGPHRFHPVNSTPANWFDPDVTENWTKFHVEGEDAPQDPKPVNLNPRLSQWRIRTEQKNISPETDERLLAQRDAFAPDPFQQTVSEQTVGDKFDPDNPQATFPIGPIPETVLLRDFDDAVIEGSKHFPVIVEAFQSFCSECVRLRPLLERAMKTSHVPIHLLRYTQKLAGPFSSFIPETATPILAIPAYVAFLNGKELARLENKETVVDFPTGAVSSVPFDNFAFDNFVFENFISSIETQFTPNGTNRVLIDFEMCVVRLQRPWMSDRLLELGNWFVPGFHKGEFSNGVDGFGAQRFAVIPIAAVLVRNLLVQARWTDEDRETVKRSINLGPFSLAGHDLDANSGKLSVSGMQVVAWACQRIPALPPNDDPELPQ